MKKLSFSNSISIKAGNAYSMRNNYSVKILVSDS